MKKKLNKKVLIIYLAPDNTELAAVLNRLFRKAALG